MRIKSSIMRFFLPIPRCPKRQRRLAVGKLGQKYSPHISVVRESFPIKDISQFSGEIVMFTYDFDIVCGDVYFWLNAESARLRELRLELGLSELDWYNRPPDNKDCFHITIGNLK